ncbi:hypothetical protein HDU93_001985 [Gonapodya sp. JEL0774]|nr:hypothetical protein HDU93_001985 [Gonapodya sp. JEL0774]
MSESTFSAHLDSLSQSLALDEETEGHESRWGGRHNRGPRTGTIDGTARTKLSTLHNIAVPLLNGELAHTSDEGGRESSHLIDDIVNSHTIKETQKRVSEGKELYDADISARSGDTERVDEGSTPSLTNDGFVYARTTSTHDIRNSVSQEQPPSSSILSQMSASDALVAFPHLMLAPDDFDEDFSFLDTLRSSKLRTPELAGTSAGSKDFSVTSLASNFPGGPHSPEKPVRNERAKPNPFPSPSSSAPSNVPLGPPKLVSFSLPSPRSSQPAHSSFPASLPVPVSPLNTSPLPCTSLISLTCTPYEQRRSVPLSLGLALYRPVTSKFTVRHLIASENSHFRNRYISHDGRGEFAYGTEEIITVSDLKRAVEDALAESGCVLVDHGKTAESDLSECGLLTDGARELLKEIRKVDTDKALARWTGETRDWKVGVATVLSTLSLAHPNLVNAGNRAFSILRGALVMHSRAPTVGKKSLLHKYLATGHEVVNWPKELPMDVNKGEKVDAMDNRQIISKRVRVAKESSSGSETDPGTGASSPVAKRHRLQAPSITVVEPSPSQPTIASSTDMAKAAMAVALSTPAGMTKKRVLPESFSVTGRKRGGATAKSGMRKNKDDAEAAAIGHRTPSMSQPANSAPLGVERLMFSGSGPATHYPQTLFSGLRFVVMEGGDPRGKLGREWIDSEYARMLKGKIMRYGGSCCPEDDLAAEPPTHVLSTVDKESVESKARMHGYASANFVIVKPLWLEHSIRDGMKKPLIIPYAEIRSSDIQYPSLLICDGEAQTAKLNTSLNDCSKTEVQQWKDHSSAERCDMRGDDDQIRERVEEDEEELSWEKARAVLFGIHDIAERRDGVSSSFQSSDSPAHMASDILPQENEYESNSDVSDSTDDERQNMKTWATTFPRLVVNGAGNYGDPPENREPSGMVENHTKLGKAKFQCMEANLLGDRKTMGDRDAGPNSDIVEMLTAIMKEYRKGGQIEAKEQFKSINYTKASVAIASLRKHPVRITSGKEAKKLSGIGERIAAHIDEFLNQGTNSRLKALQSDEQRLIVKLFTSVHDVGTKTALKWFNLGYRTLDDIRRNVKLTSNQKIGLKYYEDLQMRIPRDEVELIGRTVETEACAINSGWKLYIMGSYRRGSTSCGDVDVLLAHEYDENLEDFLGILVKRLWAQGFIVETLVNAFAARNMTEEDYAKQWQGVVKLKDKPHRRLDIFLTEYRNLGAALMHWTGNDIFNRSIRLLARKNGMNLSQKGLFTDVTRGVGGVKTNTGIRIAGQTEEEIFDALGVPYRKPEERK